MEEEKGEQWRRQGREMGSEGRRRKWRLLPPRFSHFNLWLFVKAQIKNLCAPVTKTHEKSPFLERFNLFKFVKICYTHVTRV